MEKNTNEWYGPILSKYNLKPEFIEPFGAVKKVVTMNGTFALKSIKNQRQLDFIRLTEHLYQKGYTKISPVYKTVDGQSFVFYQNQYFYLMPWFQTHLQEERAVHQKRMLRELARLHYVSAKKIPLKKEETSKIYENISNEWNSKTTFFEEYMDQAEKKWYMSPFELQFCTIFHEIMKAIHFSKNQLKEWYTLASEKGATRVVVNHGKVSCQHFVYDQNDSGLFISFENAKYTLPIYDLVRYYHKVLKTYPIKCDECKEWFDYYQEYFPYTKEEKALFLSYLVFPEQIYRTIKHYSTGELKTEQHAVNQLLNVYWQMKNIEYVVISIQKDKKVLEQEKEGATNDSP